MHRLTVIFFLFLLIFFNTTNFAYGYSIDSDMFDQELWEKAQVLEVSDLGNENTPGIFREQLLKVRMLTGDHKGQILEVKNTLSGSPGWDVTADKGDKIMVYMTLYEGDIVEVHVADFARASYINYLLFGFISVVIIVGGIKGVKALVALGLTALAIYKILLPAFLSGYSPLPITIVVLIGVTVLTMLIIAGFTRKSVAATVGTIGGVVFAGFIAFSIGGLANLTGFSTEESRMLLFVDNLTIDIKGLLFSGIIIGALGATMDVAMSVASSVDEVKKANPRLTTIELIKSGMNVGRDIMGTMVNTLILAYAGGSLPLLLLYMSYSTPGALIFNTEIIATEILRAVAGSIGVILAVPLTAIVSGVLSENKSNNEQIEYNY